MKLLLAVSRLLGACLAWLLRRKNGGGGGPPPAALVLLLGLLALPGCSALGVKFSLEVPALGRAGWESSGAGLAVGVSPAPVVGPAPAPVPAPH